jgi:hypothetical protein
VAAGKLGNVGLDQLTYGREIALFTVGTREGCRPLRIDRRLKPAYNCSHPEVDFPQPEYGHPETAGHKSEAVQEENH